MYQQERHKEHALILTYVYATNIVMVNCHQKSIMIVVPKQQISLRLCDIMPA